MNILEYRSFYLVGIKGVALTALAQCLVDAGVQVQGSDVAEEFVTQPQLDRLGIKVDIGFDHPIPSDVECVIYTAAHQSQDNQQVRQAQERGLVVVSHAEALASLFNQKQGVAVCGVGGKSTTSAMISWILSKTNRQPSFAVGVGDIIGLGKTGQWIDGDGVFVAEADEYVTDPAAAQRGEPITPRFSFLHPRVTVCTNLQFDHPDVYRDFEHTQQVFGDFFRQIKPDGALIVNGQDAPLVALAQRVAAQSKLQLWTFGDETTSADFRLVEFQPAAGLTSATFTWQDGAYNLELQLPGRFNCLNALASLAVTTHVGVPIPEAVAALASFRSTTRRCEWKGDQHGVLRYDDYAHHPAEVAQMIQAFREWYPTQRLVVAFQSHTFSRTKALFNEFVAALTAADEVAMIDIFPSAREAADSSVSSDKLCAALTAARPSLTAHNYRQLPQLASYLKASLQPGDVLITMGAGDIYQVHDMLNGS